MFTGCRFSAAVAGIGGRQSGKRARNIICSGDVFTVRKGEFNDPEKRCEAINERTGSTFNRNRIADQVLSATKEQRNYVIIRKAFSVRASGPGIQPKE